MDGGVFISAENVVILRQAEGLISAAKAVILRWTEGLISAAKAVGLGAKLLVDAADKVVLGSGRFEEIMAASQARYCLSITHTSLFVSGYICRYIQQVICNSIFRQSYFLNLNYPSKYIFLQYRYQHALCFKHIERCPFRKRFFSFIDGHLHVIFCFLYCESIIYLHIYYLAIFNLSIYIYLSRRFRQAPPSC